MRRLTAAAIAISISVWTAPIPAQTAPTEQEVLSMARRGSVKEVVQEGNALFTRGDLEGALEAYQKALGEAVGPDLAKVSYNLANTLTRLGRFEEAREAYKEALRIDPEYEDAKYNLEASYMIQQEEIIALRPQAEIEGASEQLEEGVRRILQVLEQREFDFPKGPPQQNPPPPPETSQPRRKDW